MIAAIKGVLAAVLAAKEIIALLVELIRVFAIRAEDKKKEELSKAIADSAAAKTKEEMREANEKAAASLP